MRTTHKFQMGVSLGSFDIMEESKDVGNQRILSESRKCMAEIRSTKEQGEMISKTT